MFGNCCDQVASSYSSSGAYFVPPAMAFTHASSIHQVWRFMVCRNSGFVLPFGASQLMLSGRLMVYVAELPCSGNRCESATTSACVFRSVKLILLFLMKLPMFFALDGSKKKFGSLRVRM